MSRAVPLDALLQVVRDGDEHGWDREFDLLATDHAKRIEHLAESVQRDGIREPIVIGPDGRVWDGHHRLAVAKLLGIAEVPVEFAGVADQGPPRPALEDLSDDDLPGMWSRSDFMGGSDEADRILAKRRELQAEAERIIDEKSEHAEQRGHPTFQDEGTAFILGYIAGAERTAAVTQ
ncbi:ParB N-terminal domain-containing protein [Microbacterium sp. LMI12-1-1.1]|uniref:ParB N-terminal domain-containing protein n=1 Tax=Microbacterium sp. LMI12-1-1.1 TaxID=3135225 RepID=UPI003441CACF